MADIARDCPYCGATVADVWGEIEHMETAHPDVLRERGVEPRSPSPEEQLRGAVEALEAIREAITVDGRPVSVRDERAVAIIDAILTTTGGQ